MLRFLLCSTVLLFRIQAQNGAFPLESVSLEGTALSKEFVLEIAGLRVGSPIDKAGIEADFFRDFVRIADAWQIKKFDAEMKKGSGDYVMNFNLIFETR